VTGDGLTVADLCNRFLTAKLRKQEASEIGGRTFAGYREATDLLVRTFGANRPVADLAADDFERLRATMSRRWGPTRLGNVIGRVKSVFKYGAENGLIDRPVRYGSEFRKPGKSVRRRHKAQAGPRMLEPAELRRVIEAAGQPLRAMTLLGLNCGLGNHDVAALHVGDIALGAGWLDFPRPKTGIPRRCPLWPETVAALREVIASRPTPLGFEDCGRVFLNRRGASYVRTTGASHTDLISVQFGDLLRKLGLHRPGLGFYTLRHVFRTVADAARDTPAVDLVMGHADHSMAGHYRERIDDGRLRAVTGHVRAWLWPPTPADPA
jgi:integrase